MLMKLVQSITLTFSEITVSFCISKTSKKKKKKKHSYHLEMTCLHTEH